MKHAFSSKDPILSGKKNPGLHGFVPDNSDTVLLIIDMINDLSRVSGAKNWMRRGIQVAHSIAALKRSLKDLGIPTLYANDNFGRWQSDFRQLVDHCTQRSVLGSQMARLLVPDSDDYFVLKPKHSAFFATTLDTLLSYLGAERLILTGLTANQCVLFTANDAHMRDYRLYLPQDCIVSRNAEEAKSAQFHFERILEADTRPSQELLMHLEGYRRDSGPSHSARLLEDGS